MNENTHSNSAPQDSSLVEVCLESQRWEVQPRLLHKLPSFRGWLLHNIRLHWSVLKFGCLWIVLLVLLVLLTSIKKEPALGSN